MSVCQLFPLCFPSLSSITVFLLFFRLNFPSSYFGLTIILVLSTRFHTNKLFFLFHPTILRYLALEGRLAFLLPPFYVCLFDATFPTSPFFPIVSMHRLAFLNLSNLSCLLVFILRLLPSLVEFILSFSLFSLSPLFFTVLVVSNWQH